MGEAEEFWDAFDRVDLTSPVRVRKGQVPIGKGELALRGGVLVLNVRGKERVRGPAQRDPAVPRPYVRP